MIMEPEDHSMGLYDSMKNCADAPVVRSSHSIDEQVELLQVEIRSLWDKVRALELELEGWKISRRLSTAAFDHLKFSKGKMEQDLKDAKHLMRPISLVSADIWGAIFRLCADYELEDYVKSNSTATFCSSAFKLSHVCRFWSEITSHERSLWGTVTIHPCEVWSQNKYNLFTSAMSKAPLHTTLAVNVSQTLFWTQEYRNQDWRCYNHRGENVGAVNPRVTSDVVNKVTTTHFIMKDTAQQFIKRITYAPFRPPALILSIPSSSGEAVLTQLTAFENAVSLTINGTIPNISQFFRLSAVFSALLILKLKVIGFPDEFQWAKFIPDTLQELQLCHQSPGDLPASLEDARYPALHTLTITYPGSTFFARAQLPALKNLIIHGPSILSDASVDIGDHLSTIVQQLHHLRFQDWTRPQENGSLRSAASCFGDVIAKPSSIKSVTFANCFVDGDILISVIETARQNVGVEPLAKLEEIILSHTTGITQNNCEKLRPLVKTLSTYA